MQFVKQFNGHSGSNVELLLDHNRYCVRKTGGNKLHSSVKILGELKSQGFLVPDIYNVSDQEVLMQYINGIDMKTYILSADVGQLNALIDFINRYIGSVRLQTKDYTNEIDKKIKEIAGVVNLKSLRFDLDQLYHHLPKQSDCSIIHGDFTLDNIIWYNNEFYLIDANPTEITSMEYDANKLRQDLDCLWFARHTTDNMHYRIACSYISYNLKKSWSFLNNQYILIFMLLRVLAYSKDQSTTDFLTKEINQLWP